MEDKEFEEIKRRWEKYESQQASAIINEVVGYIVFFAIVGGLIALLVIKGC